MKTKTPLTSYSNLIPEITLKFKNGNTEVTQIRSSLDSYNVLKTFYDEDTIELCESFIVLYLNRQNKSLGWIKISQGGISGTVADIRLILATGLKIAASGLIISHNHPSGNTQPSESDLRLTHKIKEGAAILDMQLLDHIIVVGDSSNYFSFADNGVL